MVTVMVKCPCGEDHKVYPEPNGIDISTKRRIYGPLYGNDPSKRCPFVFMIQDGCVKIALAHTQQSRELILEMTETS